MMIRPFRRLRREIILERPKVTICIAATCQINDDPKIVVCSDRRFSSDFGNSEKGQKQCELRPGWQALFANEADAARTALPKLRTEFQEHSGYIDETNILQIVKTALEKRKVEINDQYIIGQIGCNYDWFMTEGKQRLPDDQFTEILRDIRCTPLGAVFIIAGFDFNEQPMPLIVWTDEYCHAKIADQYAVIGQGAYLANYGSLASRAELRCLIRQYPLQCL
jgi:hypothetical protein